MVDAALVAPVSPVVVVLAVVDVDAALVELMPSVLIVDGPFVVDVDVDVALSLPAPGPPRQPSAPESARRTPDSKT